MKPILSKTLLVSAALAMSIATLILLVVGAEKVALLSKPPADFLPAERVIAVLHNGNTQSYASLAQWLPELEYITAADSDAIAFLALPGGGRGTVTFRRAAGSSEPRVGAYHIEVSDPVLATLIAQPATPLSSYEIYKDLASAHEQDATWLFMRKELLPLSDAREADAVQQLLFADSPAYGIQVNTGGTLRIDRFAAAEKSAAPIYAPVQLSGSILAMNQRALGVAWKTYLENLPSDERIIMESIARSALAKRFGNSVSMEYDILPLLQNMTELYIDEAHNITLVGSAEPERIRSTLDKITRSFVSTLPTTRIENQRFDDRFTLRTIESGTDQILEEEHTVGEWTMHVVRHATEPHVLITATHDNQFALSTNAYALEQRLRGSGNAVPLIAKYGMLTHAGMLDAKQVRAMIPSSFILEIPTFLPLSATGTIIWNVSQSGNIQTVHLHSEK